MKVLFLSMMCFVFLACNEKPKYKIEYYDSRSKKSEGFYLDNKPVDTLKTYYENGKIKSLEILNSKSQLHGTCKYYFNNGVLSEIITYDSGKKNGSYESFLSSGVLFKRAFFYDDSPMGDAFYFDSVTAKIKFYNFSNFDNKGLLLCEFNDKGEIVREDEDFFFFDSVNFEKRNYGNDSVDVLMLISHRPKSKLTLKMEGLDENERALALKEIDSKESLVKFKFPTSKNTRLIRTTSVRYDSIKNREKTFIIVRNLQ